jgi:nucleoside-diphosphate-sugar epimerase
LSYLSFSLISPSLLSVPPSFPFSPPHHQLVTGELPPVKLPWAVADVRDVAKAHVRACQHKPAIGRYLITSGTFSLREILDCVRDKIWRPLLRISVPKPALWVGFYMGMVGKKLSKDDIVHNVGYRILFDSSKARGELMPEGFVEPRETFREMYASLQEHKIIGTFN